MQVFIIFQILQYDYQLFENKFIGALFFFTTHKTIKYG